MTTSTAIIPRVTIAVHRPDQSGIHNPAGSSVTSTEKNDAQGPIVAFERGQDEVEEDNMKQKLKEMSESGEKPKNNGNGNNGNNGNGGNGNNGNGNGNGNGGGNGKGNGNGKNN